VRQGPEGRRSVGVRRGDGGQPDYREGARACGGGGSASVRREGARCVAWRGWGTNSGWIRREGYKCHSTYCYVCERGTK
jgi:hypothetical protein